MQNLDDDSLGVLIGCLPPKFRASTISLVCKTWQRVERERPYQPTDLDLRPQDVTAAFLTWHLRDASRLRAVRVSGDAHHGPASGSYCEWVPRLLRHLHEWAPALRILELDLSERSWEGGYSDASVGVLPLIGALSRLERLALRQWKYTKTQAVTFLDLARLQSLEALEISEVCFDYGHCKPKDDFPYKAEAAHALQDSLYGLQLTSLELRAVDFVLENCFHFEPEQEIGGLTKLRSLAYNSFDFLEVDRFPFVERLVKLTRLELAADVDRESLRDMLACLVDLQELKWIPKRRLRGEVVLPSAAEATKLTVEGALARNMPLGPLLPVETLRPVRSLTIHCQSTDYEELECPSAWGELSRLTSLAFRVVRMDDRFTPMYCLPDFLLEMVNLKVAELTCRHEVFDSTGESYVLLLTDRLPRLSRVQIEVRGTPDVEAEKEQLGQTCASLSMRLPDWGYSFKEERMGYDLAYLAHVVTFSSVN